MNPVVFNATPYKLQGLLMADQNGQLAYVMVVCATFAFDDQGEPFAAPTQVAVPAGDLPYGEPGRSSIRFDSAALTHKPMVDVVVQACAHAPGGQAVERLGVGVRIGGWTKVLQVTGNRSWSGPLRNKPSAPQPFTTMPVRYERAFGGTVLDGEGVIQACHVANPVGVGYMDACLPDTDVPNIELPDQLLDARGDACAVAGFGVVARNWSPRVALAGTYDQAWVKQRSPVLPVDFNVAHHQGAPLDQQFPGDLAGEPVMLRHLTPEGTWQFRMPRLSVPMQLMQAHGKVSRFHPKVDTIYINAEDRTVTLIARHALANIREMGKVEAIVMGETSPAWMRARTRGKRYVGHAAPRLEGAT